MENKEILSAERFRVKAWNYALENTPEEKTNVWIDKAMIEFAKLHVTATLQAAAENATTDYEPHWSGEQEGSTYINKDSILKSYPLDNIK